MAEPWEMSEPPGDWNPWSGEGSAVWPLHSMISLAAGQQGSWLCYLDLSEGVH